MTPPVPSPPDSPKLRRLFRSGAGSRRNPNVRKSPDPFAGSFPMSTALGLASKHTEPMHSTQQAANLNGFLLTAHHCGNGLRILQLPPRNRGAILLERSSHGLPHRVGSLSSLYGALRPHSPISYPSQSVGRSTPKVVLAMVCFFIARLKNSTLVRRPRHSACMTSRGLAAIPAYREARSRLQTCSLTQSPSI